MGGQRIDDHSNWIGSTKNGLPMGCKVKHFDNVDGAGALKNYQDTEQAIKGVQKMSVGKMKAENQPEYERN